MKVVQIGSNKSYDDLSNYLLSNYENIEFGLFVEPNSFHIESIKECYQKYDNAIIENIAIKTPNYKENQLEIYYHTSDPDYQISSCKIDHIEESLEWAKNNNKYLHDMFKDGEIKSFLVDCITLDELFEKYKIKELDWLCLDIEGLDAEILLTFDFQKYKIRRIEFEHLHLGYYKNSIKNMMLGMGYVQVNSLHEYDWAFENRNILFSKEKLKNFPSVNFISTEESENRRNLLYENFKNYGIENITSHIFEKYNDKEFMLESFFDQDLNNLLNNFIVDPEDSDNNFNLAFYYESIGQSASAISYYLRSAERTEDALLQYESLIRASMCFDNQGTRNFTVKGILQRAISICPKRPESYYLLSRFYENENSDVWKDGKWNYSYLISSLGENVSDFDSSPLKTKVNYPGKYGILYQKALAAWWCGLCDESRNIFEDLVKNYDLDEEHKIKVSENLKKFNETNKNLHEIYNKKKTEFDWGIFKNDAFTHDCFKRDILDNCQYEKLFEVEEGDIVLDIGASVGPFTYSILKKNPKIAICLEPHKELFKTLESNLSKYSNVICLNKGIFREDGDVIFKTLYDESSNQTSWEKKDDGFGITLKSLVKEYNLEKIDFLKIDCEGGEYDFFTEENFNWIKNKVKKISGEWHFYREDTRENFHWFRDNYLKYFDNFEIFFVDNDGNFHDITSQVWDDDFCQKYGWVNIYIDNRVMEKNNKLDKFPSVRFCSLKEYQDRRKNIIDQFSRYDIYPIPYIFEKIKNIDMESGDDYSHRKSYAVTLSHLHMIYDWYENTNEPYAIFCEDDLSLETIEYWNFTWKEFFTRLPEHWDCVQLSLLSEDEQELQQVKFRPRLFHYWGAQIYLIKREFAKKIIERHNYNFDNNSFEFSVFGKPFLNPSVEHILFDGGGIVYNFPLFVEDICMFESTFVDSSQRNENYCGKNSHDLILNWWKQNGLSTNLDDLMKKQYKIVDFCSFYGPYGSEMLLLRYHILKGYVDEFVVSESSYSHTGIPVEFECKKKIKEWGLPEEKFKVIELNTPPDDQLVIEEIDELNCYDSMSGNFQSDIRSKWARVRDRLSKDALLKVLDDYDDNTIFIHGDIDEIINPSYIPDIVYNFIRNNPNCFFYIPLVYLEGRADLRVYNREWNCPQAWDWAMFMCNKSLLKKVTPVQIRSNKLIPEGVETFKLNNSWTGEAWTDVGWHFSWMGGKESRLIKKQSWEHRFDSFDWLVTKKYDESDEFLSSDYQEGDTPPCGMVNLVLKNYSKENLPEQIFDIPIVEKFLFPNTTSNTSEKEQKMFKISDNVNQTCWVVDNFYEDPDAIRKFALEQEYVEGGFGRGFIGRRTEKQFLFPGLKEKFEEIMGMKITNWEEHGMNGRFQNCHSGEPLVYHCDSQRWGGMLYLTPEAPYQCGTTLYAHKKSRARTYYDQGWDDSWKDIPGDPHLDRTPFEPVDVVGNVYNRLMIFDASCIHSASEYFGTVIENSRLWQMFFFDTEGWESPLVF